MPLRRPVGMRASCASSTHPIFGANPQGHGGAIGGPDPGHRRPPRSVPAAFAAFGAAIPAVAGTATPGAPSHAHSPAHVRHSSSR